MGDAVRSHLRPHKHVFTGVEVSAMSETVMIEPLKLEHRELLFPKLKGLGLELNRYTFSELYIFNPKYKYELIHGENHFLRYYYKGSVLLLPVFDPRNVPAEKLIKALETYADSYFPIPVGWKKAFPSDRFQFSYSTAQSDYVFNIDKIRHYPGRHLSKKRNLVKQVEEQYEVVALPLTKEKINDAIKVLNDWQEGMELPGKETDYFYCLNALHLIEDLGLIGEIYYINELPVGFILGEYQTNDMFDIKFTKADKNIHGLYQYIYQSLANKLDDTCKYINFEEDLGLPYLIQSKGSYHPDRYLIKYNVNLKPQSHSS